ncbi:MAG: T9SS type A sorting domain-containing protein [Bacteriodetes bacterium]|nr:T9SS type A sorting domain-containing protein [Bacteroidota bacterium]
MQYSIDSGKTWRETGYIDPRPDARPIVYDTVQHIRYDSLDIGMYPTDHLTLLPTGHIHISHFHYRSRFSNPTPPQRISSMVRCGYATETFVSDTLTMVEVVKAGSMNVIVRYDTIVPKRSIQVHIYSKDTSQYAHFLVRAKNSKGYETQWSEDMFPRVKQELTIRRASNIKQVDTLDAGFAVNYVWYRNGIKVTYPNNPTFLWFYRTMPLDSVGTYWCEIFDTTGCVQTTAPYTYNPVSVPEETNTEIRVFPNPANESITITGIGDLVGQIEIIDMLGNVLLVSDARHRAATGMGVIDIRELPNGVYGVRIPTSHGLYQTRFVVAR